MKAARKTSNNTISGNGKTSSSGAGGGKASNSKAQAAAFADRTTQDADEMLKADHRKVEGLFEKFEQAGSTQAKRKLARQICQELIIHTLLEEEIFYPACRARQVEAEIMDEAQVEHDGAKLLINELLHEEADSDMYDAKVKVLAEYIKHHVGEEEKTSDGIFATARREGVDMTALGRRLAERKDQLLAEAEQDSLPPPMPRSLHIQTLGSGTAGHRNKETGDMNRYNMRDRDRDERNRYEEDDRGRGGGYFSRGRERDWNDDRQGGGNGGRERGWSREYEDYQGGSQSGRSRYTSPYGGDSDYGDSRNRDYGNRGYGRDEQDQSGWSRGAGGLGRSLGAGSMAYRRSGSEGRGYDDDNQGGGRRDWYRDQEGGRSLSGSRSGSYGGRDDYREDNGRYGRDDEEEQRRRWAGESGRFAHGERGREERGNRDDWGRDERNRGGDYGNERYGGGSDWNRGWRGDRD